MPSARCQADLPEQVWMERACYGASPEGDLGRDLLPSSLILVPPPLLQLSQWSWDCPSCCTRCEMVLPGFQASVCLG